MRSSRLLFDEPAPLIHQTNRSDRLSSCENWATAADGLESPSAEDPYTDIGAGLPTTVHVYLNLPQSVLEPASLHQATYKSRCDEIHDRSPPRLSVANRMPCGIILQRSSNISCIKN